MWATELQLYFTLYCSFNVSICRMIGRRMKKVNGNISLHYICLVLPFTQDSVSIRMMYKNYTISLDDHNRGHAPCHDRRLVVVTHSTCVEINMCRQRLISNAAMKLCVWLPQFWNWTYRCSVEWLPRRVYQAASEDAAKEYVEKQN